MNVVFADDSVEMRKRIRASLEQEPCVKNIYEGGNGASAFDLVSRYKPDLAILDIRMPHVDGVTLLKNIKYIYPNIAVAILTNFPLDGYREKCLAAGADYFLDKSMDFHKIPDIVRDAARRKQGAAPQAKTGMRSDH